MPDNMPHVKDQSNDGELSVAMKNFLVELVGKIQQDDDDRSQWKDKCIVANNQRLGVKRYSEYPYPGAPDIPLPETDKLIKKQVPNLVLSAWSPRTLCSVSVEKGYQENPEWEQKAKRSELAMNALLRSSKVDWLKKLLLAADYKKTYGHCLFRTREEFTSRIVTKVVDVSEYDPEIIKTLRSAGNAELKMFLADRFDLDAEDEDDSDTLDFIIKEFRSGKEVIEFDYEEIESFPNVDVPLPTKVIVPSYCTDITKSPRITFEYFLSLNELEMLMQKKIFRKRDLSSLNFANTDDDMVEQQKRRNEGLTENTNTKEMFRIRETLTYFREKETDTLSRWCFVMLADCTSPEEALLMDVPFQYEFDGWNWDKADEEVKDERYYSSRGVPEQIRAYQEIMERSINNMLIRDEMNNNPMWEVLQTSDLLDSHIRFVPGQKLPVKGLGQEIARMDVANTPDLASNNIMQVIKGYVEEYQASSDQLFRNATNAGGGKTLGEIQVGVQQNSGPLNLEVINWNETLSKVYKKMFKIMAERMGEPLHIEGQEITREDFNFPADVRSNGDLEMANQNMMVQKAQARLNAIMNPGLSDIINSEDRYNAFRDWLEKDGVKDPDKFCTNPVEIAQTQIVQLQQQISQMQAQIGKMTKDAQDLTTAAEKQKKQIAEEEAKAQASDEMTNNIMGMLPGATNA